MAAMIDSPLPASWCQEYFNYTHADGRQQVWGWKRGCWGIFERGYETTGGDFALASLTHLPTGFRFAIFTEARDAAEAAEIMDRICDWTQLLANGAAHEEWQARAKSTFEVWCAFHLFKTDLTIIADGRSVWARDLNARPDASIAGRQ